MTRVTMADVAAAAGVNKGTVSRALRGDKRISNETRERIWRIARELGYEPDAVASGLSSRRTGVVAVVVESFIVYVTVGIDNVHWGINFMFTRTKIQKLSCFSRII